MSMQLCETIEVDPRGRSPRHGFSILEVMVALTIFGIAIAGLFPLLAKFPRDVLRLEKCSPETGRWEQDPKLMTWTYYHRDPNYTLNDNYKKLPSEKENQYSYPDQWNLVPAADPWMWKLGAAASLVPDNPSQLTALGGTHVPYCQPFPAPLAPTPVANAGPPSDGYSEGNDSGWSYGPIGYIANVYSRRHPSGSSPVPAAAWTFQNVQPGWYDVMAIWPAPMDDPRPLKPNETTSDTATESAIYQLADGSLSPIPLGERPASLPILTKSVRQDVSLNGEWQLIVKVYIPKRDDNGNAGDTVHVQILVPTTGSAGAGFITADGMRLEAKTPNTIKRSGSLEWSWLPGSQQVTAKVKVTINP